MATSGTISTTVFNTRRVIDRAFGRCKLKPQEITAEWLAIATDNLYLLLSHLVNRGLPLWALEYQILPLYQGQAQIQLPLGTVDLQSANFRSLTRVSGTNTSSAGGTVGNAFDDDFATSCTQTSTNGNISTQFATATAVSTVGFLPNATATWTLVIERSTDGTTWTTVRTLDATAFTAGVWAWYDLDGVIAAEYIRLRETGGGTLDLRELFWGNTPTEVPLSRLNQDQYTALPNKTAEGQPVQYWLDRRRGASDSLPTMYTWPVCDLGNRYGQLTVWRERYLQDVGTLVQEIEVPQRWYLAIVAELAVQIGREHPSVEMNLTQELERIARQTWTEAQLEETDDSPQTFTPTISVYTR